MADQTVNLIDEKLILRFREAWRDYQLGRITQGEYLEACLPFLDNWAYWPREDA